MKTLFISVVAGALLSACVAPTPEERALRTAESTELARIVE